MNKAILIGRLVGNPKLKFINNGKAVANFTIAVDRPFKNQHGEKEADFVPIVVWGKLAENCANHIGKGQLVAVEGRLQIRSYDLENGQRKYMTEVVAETVQFLDRKKAEEDETGEPDLDISDFDGMDLF